MRKSSNHTSSSNNIKHRRSSRRPVPYKRNSDLSAELFIGDGQGRSKTTRVTIPRSMQFFPDRYRAWCSIETNGSFSANSYTHTFQINDPFNLYGPRINYAGTFGTNVPSGAKYLLSGYSDAGSGAPYQDSIVLRHSIEVQVGSNSVSANSIPFIAGITYTNNLTATQSMSFTQICEQERTMYASVPHLTTVSPIRIANSVHLASLVGMSESQYLGQHITYGADVSTSPVVPMYCQLWFRSFDPPTSGAYAFVVRHRFEVEFFNLTSFLSDPPAFLRAPSAPRIQPDNKPEHKSPGWYRL